MYQYVSTYYQPFYNRSPVLGQTRQISSSFVVKRDRGSKGVNINITGGQSKIGWYTPKTHLFTFIINIWSCIHYRSPVIKKKQTRGYVDVFLRVLLIVEYVIIASERV